MHASRDLSQMITFQEPSASGFLENAWAIPHFKLYILIANEAGSTRDGTTNFHNQHACADKNPCGTLHSRQQ
jgi:hypothetical protein